MGEIISGCSPMHVWKALLPRRVDEDLYALYVQNMAGREMRDVDQLVGKELRELVTQAERFYLGNVECQRLTTMLMSDAGSVWWHPREDYVSGRRCPKGSGCPRLHVVDRR